MNYLNLYLQLLWLYNIRGFGASSCNDQQHKENGLCCDMCQPGHYVLKFCSSSDQTVCKPCDPGYFSENYNVFGRCKECRVCEQEYTRKCTATTDAQCACLPGFLCSNNLCSKCEKNKCVSGETLRTTAIVGNTTTTKNFTKYIYKCEATCPDHSFYDDKKKICIPRTLCSAFGHAELFEGNKTHNAKCHSQSNEVQKVYVPVIVSLVLFSVIIIVVFSCLSMKKKKTKATTIESVISVECYKMSTEESGLTMEQKDESFG